MGNRAIVVFKDEMASCGVYLHWNGGPESVLAFLQVMQERMWTRMDYAPARFAAVVSEFFDSDGEGDGLSLAVQPVSEVESWQDGLDNGVYEVSSKGDGFTAKQRGKPISKAKLSAKDQEKMQQIVDVLAEIRAARKARKGAV